MTNSVTDSINIRNSKKEELKKLEVERKAIFNSLDSRISRYDLKNNTWRIAMNTGFSIIEVEGIWDSRWNNGE